MHYLRGIGPLLAFVLAMLAATPCCAAGIAYAPSVDTSMQNGASLLYELLPLSVSESGWQASDDVLLAVIGGTDTAGGTHSAVSLNDYGKDDVPEMGDAARHRGYIKFLFIVLACGAVLRFLSSPTFLNFITDALDPKAW
jgi:hypothetical protein